MVDIKRGTTPTLKVRIELAEEDFENLASVDFVLKQDCKEECQHYVLKSYPSESVSLDSDEKVFLIRYTEEETRIFNRDTNIYLDTRPVLNDGRILATEIVKLYSYNTLFAAQTAGHDDD